MEKKIINKKKGKRKRTLLIIMGTLIFLALIFPFLLNVYLKNKLPDLVNEKTPYQISLSGFDLNLFKGNISANALIIKTKQTNDPSITQINGNIKSLRIQNFGIWNAIFRKSYHVKNIQLIDPNVQVMLGTSKKKKDSVQKKMNFDAENILITNGNISVKGADKKDLINGKNIHINLTEIHQSQNTSKLPISFKDFKIKAHDVLITVNDFYQIFATKIDAKNKQLTISEFHLKPIESPALYNAKNIFDLKINQLSAKNFVVDQDSLIVESVRFTKPQLTVTSTYKKEVQENPKEVNLKIGIKNLDFGLGSIVFQQRDKTKIASVDNFHLNLKDIVFDKKTVKEKIPFAFSKHMIEFENIYFKSDPLQAVSIKKITSNNSDILINDVEFRALGKSSVKDLFNIKTEKIEILKNTSKFSGQQLQLKLGEINVYHPDIEIIAATHKKKDNKKNHKEVPELLANLRAINIINGTFIQKENGKKKLKVDNFRMNLKNIVFNEKTVKEKIPFAFSKHNIELQNIYFKSDPLQEVNIKKIISNNSDIFINNVQFKALGKSITKDLFNIKTEKIEILNNTSKFAGQQLQLKLGKINVYHPDIEIIAATNKKKDNKKNNKVAPDLLANLNAFNIINGTFIQKENGHQKMKVENFNVQLNSIITNRNILKESIPFHAKNQLITAHKIDIDAGKYYRLKLDNIKNAGKLTTITNFSFIPKYSRDQFNSLIAVEEDLYTIKTKSIIITDNNSTFGSEPSIDLDHIIFDSIDCNIYHDLAPPDDIGVRYMFSKKLRDVKFPLYIKQIDIKNSKLSYEEIAEKAKIPGEITFGDFNAKISNVNNTKLKGRSTIVNVDSNFNFFADAPTDVHWQFDVANKNDDYTINGTIRNLSIKNANLFVRPYLNVSLDGQIQYLKFDYIGDNKKIGGNFYFNYADMHVSFMNKNTGKERKILNAITNILIKKNSKGAPDHAEVDIERDPNKSFFNTLWQGIMAGLKKYLI